jgi:hypothetical protein
MLERIKDASKKIKQQFGSISRSLSQSANISTDTRLQVSDGHALIHRTDQASETAMHTTPDPPKQSQPTKAFQTSLTEADEQLLKPTVRVSL